MTQILFSFFISFLVDSYINWFIILSKTEVSLTDLVLPVSSCLSFVTVALLYFMGIFPAFRDTLKTSQRLSSDRPL